MDKNLKQRLLFFDNLKGFAILLVVLGHCIQKYDVADAYQFLYKFIYSFHMPLFMMVSGYFGYKEHFSIFTETKKRFVRLIIPYFVWGGVKLYTHNLPFSELLINPDGFLWFLWDLFIISFLVNVVLILLSLCCKTRNIVLTILILLSLTLLLLGKHLPDNDYDLKSICWMFQFYVSGLFYKNYIENISIYNKYCGHIGFVSTMFLVVMVWLRYTYLSPESLLSYGAMFVNAYLGCFACFSLFKAYANSKLPLTYLGVSTLGIYAIHQSLLSLFGIYNIWVAFVVVLVSSLLFVYVLRKTKYLKFIIGE